MKKFHRKFKKHLKKISLHADRKEVNYFKLWFLSLLKFNITIKQQKTSSLNVNRGEIYRVDFGVGVGSEYRYPHFCVILKIIGPVAIVVPLTSNVNICSTNPDYSINLGVINKMPLDPITKTRKNSVALVDKIQHVSLERLTLVKGLSDTGYFKILHPKLNSVQLNALSNVLSKLTQPGNR